MKTSQLKMTSFEYAYELPKIREVLGLNFGKEGLLASRRIGAGQRRGLIYLLERFRAGTLNTRSPELKAKKAHTTRSLSSCSEWSPARPAPPRTRDTMTPARAVPQSHPASPATLVRRPAMVLGPGTRPAVPAGLAPGPAVRPQ